MKSYDKKPGDASREKGKWIFTSEVYDEICNTIGRRIPEWGGALGSSDGVHIDYYYFDQNAVRSSYAYKMNVNDINQVVRQWNSKNIQLVGIIHSHPAGMIKPSYGDMETAKHIIETIHVNGEFFTPIVQVDPKLNGEIEIYPYTFQQVVEMVEQPFEIEKESPEEKERKKREELAEKAPRRFERIKEVFPNNLMSKKKVICIGCGGSRAFLESLARCGVGNFVLIDGDKYEDKNIATQGTSISELGKYKTEVIRGRILDINPLANVVCVNQYLDNSISDIQFAKLVGIKMSATEDTLICGCTDNFNAQDRSSQLCLKYKIPYLSAQIFAGGTGHEVLFWYPGLTKSCPRCMLETRYKKILSSPEKATGSSSGAAVCVTDYLNSIKGYLALTILCYKEKTTPYYHKLDKYLNHNYFMTKCSDDLKAPAFDSVNTLCVKEPDLLFPYMTVAIGQTPESDCPLCKGNYDSKKCKIADTRVLVNPYKNKGKKKKKKQ